MFLEPVMLRLTSDRMIAGCAREPLPSSKRGFKECHAFPKLGMRAHLMLMMANEYTMHLRLLYLHLCGLFLRLLRCFKFSCSSII